MSEFTLTEAINSARQMANFFKAFKKIEEVISVASLLEQGIRELESRKERLSSEISDLSMEKEETMKGFSESITQAKKTYSDECEELTSELRELKKAFEKEKEGLLLEIDVIKTSKMNAINQHSEVMETINSEKSLAEESLMLVKKELENIKNKLN